MWIITALPMGPFKVYYVNNPSYFKMFVVGATQGTPAGMIKPLIGVKTDYSQYVDPADPQRLKLGTKIVYPPSIPPTPPSYVPLF